MPDIVLAKENEKYWITYIKRRIKKNKNFLAFVSGQTGSGKSWSCLRIGEDLDKNFCIEQVVFTGTELMKLINGQNLKKGSVIIFEEAGVALSNRNWQSTINKMLNYLLQTFRHRNFILIMNSPYMDFVDAATRKLFHAEIATVTIDFKNKITKLKPQLIQYNARLQKFYFKRLRVTTKDGVIPVDFWNVKKPSAELIKQYEAKKLAYTKQLNQNILDELAEIEQKKKKGKTRTPNNKKDIDLDRLMDLKLKGLTHPEIAGVFHCTPRTITNYMRKVRNRTKKTENELLIDDMSRLRGKENDRKTL